MDDQLYEKLRKNSRKTELKEKLSDSELREFLEIEERRSSVSQIETEEEDIDTWRCERCEEEFKRPRGKIPLECDGCGKSPNKTVFEAITGPYKFFDLQGRKRFVPKRLGDEILKQDHFITRKDSKEIYRFEGSHYEHNAEDYIKQRAQGLLEEESVSNRKEEVLEYIKTETLVEAEDIDKEENLIAVENGILDTLEREIMEPNPNIHHITQQIPVRYDPKAEFEGSNIHRFLKEVFNKEDLPAIKRFLGTALLKNYDFKKALVLVGPTNSGKSTVLDLLESFLGSDNTSKQSLQEIADYPFSKANLMGKLINISADLSTKEVKNIGTIKELTGGDTVNAPRKHIQGDLHFTNYAKLVFSCNQLPKIRLENHTDAFWNRWLIITVDKHIFNPSEENTMRKEELINMLTQPEELSALLNWALQGLQDVKEEGHFSQSERALNGKEKWIAHTDNLRAFVDRFCERDSDGRIVKDDFYHAYTKHCEKEDRSPIDKREVGKKLPKIIGSIKAKRPKIHYDDSHKQVRCWEGIKFHEDTKYSKYNRSIKDSKSGKKENTDENQATLVSTPEPNEKTLKEQIIELSDDDGFIFLDDMTESIEETSTEELKNETDRLVEEGFLKIIEDGIWEIVG